MCTVSWLRRDAGYELFFNRDERRTRGAAEPPALRHRGNSPFLAPLDGDHGGSWLVANAHGVTLALLNAYASDEPASEPRDDAGFTSRGLLVTGLAGCRSAEQSMRRLARMDSRRFRSFLLLALDPDRESRLATWSGGRLGIEEGVDDRSPLISSAFDTSAVCDSRRTQFERMRDAHRGDPTELHLRFHSSHLPERGARSVCMHRPDARTVSFSRVVVDDSGVAFHYAPDSPCRALPVQPTVRLTRNLREND